MEQEGFNIFQEHLVVVMEGSSRMMGIFVESEIKSRRGMRRWGSKCMRTWSQLSVIPDMSIVMIGHK